MKVDLVAVFLMAALAVSCRGMEEPQQINKNQREAKAKNAQPARIRWQFDTHG